MRVRGKPATETGPLLLEREPSLALLSEYAAQAAGGEGRLVLLSGEAGVGKSALVERLCRDLPGARWSWSMCDGLFTPRPLGPLFDLADQLGGALLERCRDGADREELFRTLLGQVSASGVLDVVVRAYATFANQRMLYADYDVAIDLALRAQALATRFGATDVHSDALNTQAASRSAQGLDWAGQMRRALDIALAGSHHHEAGRAYTNLSGIHAGKREFAEAERYLEPGIAFCDEHDITTL